MRAYQSSSFCSNDSHNLNLLLDNQKRCSAATPALETHTNLWMRPQCVRLPFHWCLIDATLCRPFRSALDKRIPMRPQLYSSLAHNSNKFTVSVRTNCFKFLSRSSSMPHSLQFTTSTTTKLISIETTNLIQFHFQTSFQIHALIFIFCSLSCPYHLLASS